MMTRIHLLLLCVFSLSSAIKYQIDYSRCYTDMKCAVRESCIEGKPATADQTMTLLTVSQKLIDGCDAIIQIRSYSFKKYLMMIQINASKSAKDLTAEGAEFAQGQFKLKCEKEHVSGDSAFEIETLETRHADKVLFCSFTLRAADDSEMEDKFRQNNDAPVLKFESEATHEIKGVLLKGREFWRSVYVTNCNPDEVLTNTTPDATYVVDQLDTSLSPPLTCNPPQNLRIVNDAGKTLLLATGERIDCKDKKWNYKNGPNEEIVNTVITAHCVEKFCTLCNPLETNPCGAACSTPSNSAESDMCKPLDGSACPNSQWMVDGDQAVIVKSITCEKDKEDLENRKAAWYMDAEDSSERVKVTKVACFNKSVCWKTASIVENCDKAGANMECTSFNRTSDDTKIYCTEGYTLMHSYGGVIPIETESITCDFQTGVFRDGNSTEILKGTAVFCGRRKEAVNDEKAAAAAGHGLEIGGGVGGLVLLVIIGVVVFVVIRRRRAAAEATNKVEGEPSGQPTQSTPDAAAADQAKAATTRGAWLARDRALAPIDRAKIRDEKSFSKEELLEFHLKEFAQYALVERVELLAEYSSRDDTSLFWRFFRAFEERNLDCMVIWVDSRGVNIGVLYREWNSLLRNRLLRFALPIHAELGWVIRPDEQPSDTWMRFLVLRILLWAEEPVTCKELRRLTTFPVEAVESPLRAVVLQYAVRHMDRGIELKAMYWQTHILADPRNADGDKFGTIRQHLLYALATHDKDGIDENVFTKEVNDEYRFVRLFFNKIYQEPEVIFTPMDGYWAYRGATEYYGSMKTARRLFSEYHTESIANTRNEQLDQKCKGMSPDAKAAMKKDWMLTLVDTASLMFECCTTKEQADDVATGVNIYMKYCDPLKPIETGLIASNKLYTRAQTYGRIFFKDIPKETVFRDYTKNFRSCEYPTTT